MKLLLDQNLSFKLCAQLSDIFPESNQARLMGLAEVEDALIWERAKSDCFVILTQDSDFADRSVLYGPPPKVIWLRCGNQRTSFIEALLRANSGRILEFEREPTTGCLEIY